MISRRVCLDMCEAFAGMGGVGVFDCKGSLVDIETAGWSCDGTGLAFCVLARIGERSTGGNRKKATRRRCIKHPKGLLRGIIARRQGKEYRVKTLSKRARTRMQLLLTQVEPFK